MTRVVFHPAAGSELDESIGFYESREPGLGLDLEREVLRGVSEIGDAPEQWSVYTYGTRKCLLRRFPFQLIYLQLSDAIWIVAVAHCSRRPGYWKARVRDVR